MYIRMYIYIFMYVCMICTCTWICFTHVTCIHIYIYVPFFCSEYVMYVYNFRAKGIHDHPVINSLGENQGHVANTRYFLTRAEACMVAHWFTSKTYNQYCVFVLQYPILVCILHINMHIYIINHISIII